MKWSKEECDKAITLLKNGNSFEVISEELNRSKKSIKEKLNELGYKQSDYFKKEYRITNKCENCGDEYERLITQTGKFCSQSCSATFNNKLRTSTKTCLICDNILKDKRSVFCSTTCQQKNNKNIIFEKIEKGDMSLNNRQYKKYLIETHGDKCMDCGWCEKNIVTNKVPIELEHIDGNSENNSLDNLKLLCPNCHSLTPTYKALNKGNGRHSRMIRYNEGKSY